ncbi:hypothetical protein L916_19183 [Phytophthora nicotianae]|uniref:Uncharacterized protein n=1 Tax=Phytophthora nicotianae TaxID=4792 RepID=W2I190_PHYNI|nr:hypothetical protein L916_19183 [Phytophthora nicotianae]
MRSRDGFWWIDREHIENGGRERLQSNSWDSATNGRGECDKVKWSETTILVPVNSSVMCGRPLS